MILLVTSPASAETLTIYLTTGGQAGEERAQIGTVHGYPVYVMRSTATKIASSEVTGATIVEDHSTVVATGERQPFFLVKLALNEQAVSRLRSLLNRECRTLSLVMVVGETIVTGVAAHGCTDIPPVLSLSVDELMTVA